MTLSKFLRERLSLGAGRKIKFNDARRIWDESGRWFRSWRSTGLMQGEWRSRHAQRARAVDAAWRALEQTMAEEDLNNVMHRLADLADVLLDQMGTPDVRNRLSPLIPALEESRKTLSRSVQALDAACERLIEHIRSMEQ
ncbi:hypothetical protein AURDEDRAFT_178181 [Auricularia subglabra TFB-10046 SS5]|uniref:Uncharacterized protein n=1 Tax=Auricularia subglabra (strain TFB-10046 / SS5) TaxID=717982 RepID=J0WLQ4_AURST|nr:hypothetical protein AURDEDRAFT_178181 [Auricularia subglabra TFB-10046 SS5]